jgi:hypothetical protein
VRGDKNCDDYKDPGFCKSATTDEIRKNNYILTPGRYVGMEEIEDDANPSKREMKDSQPNSQSSSKNREIWKKRSGRTWRVLGMELAAKITFLRLLISENTANSSNTDSHRVRQKQK